jgi:hypothetical protein
MTDEHLAALLAAAEAKKDKEGWHRPPEGRPMTLYAAAGGALLTVTRVEAVRADKGLVQARTTKGETYVLALADLFAGAVEAQQSTARKAGFA